jgi:ketosteroid isomerase-like protein
VGEVLVNPTSHKALVRRLHEIWNTGDVAAIEDVYAADFVAHFPPSTELPERRGLEGVRTLQRPPR